MSIYIPEIIQNFIKQEISIECLCLPQDYLDLKKVNKMQAGFRYNALTNESTIGTQRGD
jgi:predicted PolB exonuclease-like 3'-5' exonuclease